MKTLLTALVAGLTLLVPMSASAYTLTSDEPIIYTDDVHGVDFNLTCSGFGGMNPGYGILWEPDLQSIHSGLTSCSSYEIEEIQGNLPQAQFTGTRHFLVVDPDWMGSDDFRWDYEGMSSTTAPWFLGHFEFETSANNRP